MVSVPQSLGRNIQSGPKSHSQATGHRQVFYLTSNLNSHRANSMCSKGKVIQVKLSTRDACQHLSLGYQSHFRAMTILSRQKLIKWSSPRGMHANTRPFVQQGESYSSEALREGCMPTLVTWLSITHSGDDNFEPSKVFKNQESIIEVHFRFTHFHTQGHQGGQLTRPDGLFSKISSISHNFFTPKGKKGGVQI